MGDNLSQDAIDELHALRAIYEDDIKIDLVCEPILFDWIETLKRKLETLAEILADSDESEVEEYEDEGYEEEPQECWEQGEGLGAALRQGGAWGPPSDAGRPSRVLDSRRTDLPEIVHGEPFTEKKSTFQAHLCRVKSHEDVQGFIDFLMTIPKIQHATHNIMAYRYVQDNGAQAMDCDDDGESAAGKRLLTLLQVSEAEDVCVVVSRWYGGILLGPARFTHINNAARQLLEAQGIIPPPHAKSARGSRK